MPFPLIDVTAFLSFWSKTRLCYTFFLIFFLMKSNHLMTYMLYTGTTSEIATYFLVAFFSFPSCVHIIEIFTLELCNDSNIDPPFSAYRRLTVSWGLYWPWLHSHQYLPLGSMNLDAEYNRSQYLLIIVRIRIIEKVYEHKVGACQHYSS